MKARTTERRLKTATGGVALALGLGLGCGAAPHEERVARRAPAPAASVDPAAVNAAIAESLARLSRLDYLSVGDVITSLPAEARGCYGVPCPGTREEVAYEADRVRQAPRVAELARLASAVEQETDLAPATGAAAARAVQALNALEIVTVEQLALAQPASNAECYSLPCSADVARADRENGLRAPKLAALAAEAVHEKL